MGLNNLKIEKEHGEIRTLFLLHGIKNSYSKTLEKSIDKSRRIIYTTIKKGQEALQII